MQKLGFQVPLDIGLGTTEDLRLLFAFAGVDFVEKLREPEAHRREIIQRARVVKTDLEMAIDDDSDLMNEDSLLIEDDLKTPHPVADDFEVGSTMKACKNCTCGRAEAEEKVEKLQSTVDLSSFQSPCGSGRRFRKDLVNMLADMKPQFTRFPDHFQSSSGI